MRIDLHNILRVLMLASTLLAGLWLLDSAWPLLSRRVGPEQVSTVTASVEWPSPILFQPDDWQSVRRRELIPVGASGALAERFRLAGTFSAFPGDVSAASRGRLLRAIIDDIRAGKQHLVQEGERIDRVEIARIHADRVVLRGPDGEEESLFLTFRSGAVSTTRMADDAVAPVADTPLRFEDMPAITTSRFGKQIGDNRWVFGAEALNEYYDEVIQDPERLAAILLAMQPDFDDDGDVAGYQLELLGEDILYEAAGMLEGDIVRAVNSMPMTSPARAQYFISEFLQGNISAIVLDVEREGVESKLIYLIR
jgi:type II secretory pathway component PulC